MRSPFKMHEHPEDRAAGDTRDQQTAGLQYSHHLIERNTWLDEVLEHMSGHYEIKFAITVRELAHVGLAQRQLNSRIAKTTARPLEHARRYIDSIEL